MVDLIRPSEFEDFAHSYILSHPRIYPTLPMTTELSLRHWLVRTGMINGSTLRPNHRGKIYGLDLEATYGSWFHPGRESFRDNLDRFFLMQGRKTLTLTMDQRGPKPVAFFYHIPAPYLTESEELLMLRLQFDFGNLTRDEFGILGHCISDNDSYPNEFWLVPKGRKSLLGLDDDGLFSKMREGDHVLHLFTNIDQHAIVIEAKRSRETYETTLSAYFTRSERIPYADSLLQLRYKIKPMLLALNRQVEFENAVRKSMEVKLNSGEEWTKHPVHEFGSAYPPFEIDPRGELRRTLGTPSRKIIALVATRPPPYARSIPWLGKASPWLIYHSHGTLDSDLDKGAKFLLHPKILELDQVVLSEVVITRVRRGTSNDEGVDIFGEGQAI